MMLNVHRNHQASYRREELGEGVWRWGKREIICLSLYCSHQNDSCNKTGNDESHSNVSVEIAQLSELEFKHQVTTARGQGGRRGRGHESAEVPRCPQDRKRDGGRGGRGVVASRGWEGQ